MYIHVKRRVTRKSYINQLTLHYYVQNAIHYSSISFCDLKIGRIQLIVLFECRQELDEFWNSFFYDCTIVLISFLSFSQALSYGFGDKDRHSGRKSLCWPYLCLIKVQREGNRKNPVRYDRYGCFKKGMQGKH